VAIFRTALVGLVFSLVTIKPADAGGRKTITGSFWEEGESRAYFELYLVPNQRQRVLIYRKRVIEVWLDSSDVANVRLLDRDRNSLFEAQLTGALANSFRLAACGSEFELANSANSRAPSSCEQRGGKQ
jgi:hypothetical protein